MERFSELLAKDEGIWDKKLEEASQNTQCDEKLDPLLENFHKQFKVLLMPETTSKVSMNSFVMRKLPMWGN